MNQSFHLYQLQKIDTHLDQIQKRVTEIDQILQNDQTVQEAQNAAAAAEQNLKNARRNLQKVEDTVKSVQIKIETDEASLYGGKIRNPKELQDLEKDIAALKKQIRTLEDGQLNSMVALEEAEQAGRLAAARLTGAQADAASRSAGLLGERSQLQREREKLETERTVAAAAVLPENFAVYQNLRRMKRGVAVATIVDESCSGCGSSLTPAEWQAARSPHKIVICSTCSRILYAG